MAVKAVIFDVGNVLFRWEPEALYRDLIPDAGERAWFLANVVTNDWHFQHDAGRLFAETSAELIARFPQMADLIRVWGERFNDTITGGVPGMAALVEQLHESGVPLFAITNFSAEFWRPFVATQPIFTLFSDIVVSGEEKLAKPDPAIFHLAMTRFGLGAGEALFVDDVPANAEAASRCGLIGHHFSDVDRLRAELVAHNLIAA